MTQSRPSRPLVIAHRGASGHRPENTRSAYELAVEQAADMIEIDLHLCLDQHIMVTHDRDLTGLGGDGDVSDQAFAEIRSLDAGDGQVVPTLEEVLEDFGPRIAFNLELKDGSQGRYPGLERATLDLVTAHGLMTTTLFSSFNDEILQALVEADPHTRLALLIGPLRARDAVARALEVGAEALNPWRGLVTPALVEEVHAAGLAMYVFTVDEPPEMQRLLNLGVDGIFTNYPDRLRKLVGPNE
ncbi:glycerophosphodiester phosphodiesterase [Myxococcota bacterium]|nr:glycerophosphodiester phosphodiesterase [Myxococcota bacterium]